METHARTIVPRTAAVKPAVRARLFASYTHFCQDHHIDDDSYPINTQVLQAFCRSISVGKKSRKARKQRRIIKDVLSRPARLRAGVLPKAGPPKGPRDQNGHREHYTIDACRRGGIKSGAVRRHKVQKRNTSIREMVYKHGHTRQHAANHHGISLRTVYYVLSNATFTRAPKILHDENCPQHATNSLRQAARCAGWRDVVPQPAVQCAGCRDVVPQPAVPVFARSTITLKLFWLDAAQALLEATSDNRWKAIHNRTIRRLNREIAKYKAAIKRSDPDRAQRVIDASKAWLAALRAAFDDPLPILVRHQQQTMAQQRARQHPPTKRKPKRKEPRA